MLATHLYLREKWWGEGGIQELQVSFFFDQKNKNPYKNYISALAKAVLFGHIKLREETKKVFKMCSLQRVKYQRRRELRVRACS